MKINSDFINDVKSKLDIVDVIGALDIVNEV